MQASRPGARAWTSSPEDPGVLLRARAHAGTHGTAGNSGAELNFSWRRMERANKGKKKHVEHQVHSFFYYFLIIFPIFFFFQWENPAGCLA